MRGGVSLPERGLLRTDGLFHFPRTKMAIQTCMLILALATSTMVSADRRPSAKYHELPNELKKEVDKLFGSSDVTAYGAALEELGQLDLHDAKRMRVDQTGKIYVVEDAVPAPMRRSAVLRQAIRDRFRRMFSGTSATGITPDGKRLTLTYTNMHA